MKSKICVASLLLFFASSLHAQSNPALFRCKDQKHIINLSINNSGEMVEGPACAQIVINALRYGADFGKTVTYTTGANLPSIFPSTFSGGGGLEKEKEKEKAESLNEHFNSDFTAIKSLQGQLPGLEALNRTTGSDTDKYLASLRALIAQTDETLKAGGPPAVVALITSADTKRQMDDVLKNAFNWKTTDGIIAALQRLQADLNALPASFPANTGTVTGDSCTETNIGQLGWADWSKCRDAQYKAAQAIVAAALTEAGAWTSDSDKAAQFVKKIGIVLYWKNTIGALNADSFTLQAEVQCGVLFNKNAQTTLKLILVDRTSVFDGQIAQPQTKDGLLTVTCSSPFAISAGAAFSTIRNRQFAIVKSVPPSGQT